MESGEHRGRGVLEGAFRVLEALSRSADGSRLADLARAVRLPKATVHRLLEQLVSLGAVHRHEQRYFIGRSLARLGAAWNPDPRLQHAAREPVQVLAALTGTAVVVTVLHEDRVRVVAETRCGSVEFPPMRPGDTLPDATAAGKVLLAGRAAGDRLPVERRRRQILARVGGPWLAEQHPAGVSCVAAPIWHPDGSFAGSVGAVVVRRTAPGGLAELVRRASQEITDRLPHPRSFR
ncbi:IclR family transcriptional regulator [Amycolatopsis sp. NPDC004772]